MIKNLLFLIAICTPLLILPNTINAQTTLSAGDIAIIGISSDTPDDFHFVLLTDIESGTEIRFTDSGVLADGTFRGGEGSVKYTAASALDAGTVICYTVNDPDFVKDGDAIVGGGSIILAMTGDQLFAYQGNSDNPNFIFGIQTNSSIWQADASNSNTSALPAGLTNALNAVAVGSGPGDTDEYDNASYDMSIRNGPSSYLLAAIADTSNWVGNNAEYDPPTGSFNVGTDDVAPGIDETSPENNEDNVPVNAMPEIFFDEPIYEGEGILYIRNENGSIFESFDISEQGAGADLEIFDDNYGLKIRPNSELINGNTYYIEMDAGIVKDHFNNNFAGIQGSSTWSFTIATATESEETLSSDIRIYPVPVSTELILDNIMEIRHLEILDITGRRILSQNLRGQQQHRISVSDFTRGIYFIKLSSNTKTITRKFIKK